MKIIREKESGRHVSYVLNFQIDGSRRWYSFPCDEHGTVHPRYLESPYYLGCLKGKVEWTTGDGEKVINLVGPGRIKKRDDFYVTPAVGECDCGTKVTLSAFTNTCLGCGADYNWSGQILAPRSQWGEETGEHWSDCY